MPKYFSESNLENRVADLLSLGYSVNWTWSTEPCQDLEYIIEIADRKAVSKPCFEELLQSADSCDAVIIFLRDVVFTDSFPSVELPEKFRLIRFFYSDRDSAMNMELRVRSSAKNKRKDRMREQRLAESGGFHDEEVLEKLYLIQKGKCYYSGAPLERSPKNYAVDHLDPIYLGGSDWPENLALVLTEVNLKKGGTKTDKEILHWLAKSKGEKWLDAQLDFMGMVDKKRKKLDQQFKSKYAK